MKKIRKQAILIILTLTFVLLLCGAASATSYSDIYISPTGNDSNDGNDINNPVQTIQRGIYMAEDNGTLHLANGTYNKYIDDSSRDYGIEITKNLTIIGANNEKTIIDAMGNSEIFDIPYNYNSTVLIKEITFQNGRLSNSGGAISSDGTLTVENCIFKNNTAVDDGGGALFTHTTLNVVNCIFTDNKADAGAAIFNKGGILTVTGSIFSGNEASTSTKYYEGGGAIYLYGGPFQIVGNSFINNIGSAIKIASKVVSIETIQEILHTNININRFTGNSPYAIYMESAETKDTESVSESAFSIVINATNNWWGSNSNPKSNLANIGGDINRVLADPWLILTVFATPGSVPFGSNAHVFAKVTQNSNGEDTSSLGHIPDGTPITITTDIGNVGSKSVIKYTISGVATAILRADDGFGIAHLYAILDGFRTPVPAQVTIVQAASAKSTEKTIGMLPTGLPLAGLILGILALFGGFIAPRKK
ncbi:MAG TPA: hypothetical protein VK426_03195 [Methanobacterium sp.]|nr:hypothetical protein [Methanobacterium sp.]